MSTPYPLPLSGPISFLDIQREHFIPSIGGIRASNFYKGSNGPVLNRPSNFNVPFSGQVGLNNFYGTSGLTLLLGTNQFVGSPSNVFAIRGPALGAGSGVSNINLISSATPNFNGSFTKDIAIDRTQNLVFKGYASSPFFGIFVIGGGSGSYGKGTNRSNFYGLTSSYGNTLSPPPGTVEGDFSYDSRTLVTTLTNVNFTQYQYSQRFHIYQLVWYYDSYLNTQAFGGVGSKKTILISGSINGSLSHIKFNSIGTTLFGIGTSPTTAFSTSIHAFRFSQSTGNIDYVYPASPVPGFPAETVRFGDDVDVHPNNDAVAYCGSITVNTSSRPFIQVFRWSDAGGFGSAYSSPTFSGSTIATSVAFSKSGDVILFGYGEFQGTIFSYDWNSTFGFGSARSTLGISQPGPPEQFKFSNDNSHLFVSSITGNGSRLYSFSGGDIQQSYSYSYASTINNSRAVFM